MKFLIGKMRGRFGYGLDVYVGGSYLGARIDYYESKAES